MTFLEAPLSVDGALIGSAHVRRGNYMAARGNEGILEGPDLKVSQLPTPGNGVLISAGNGVVKNRYQTVPNEAYVVANPSVHTVLPESMPTSQPSAKSYLVLVTVGDPEFSQVGHPWMPSEPLDPEEAEDFQYVRVWLYEVAAGTTAFTGGFPALVLARIDIPPSTTTITNVMITDLRKLANPRVSEELYIVNGLAANDLNTVSPAYETFGQSQSVAIPTWASRAKATVHIEGLALSNAINAYFRLNVVSGPAGSNIPFNKSAPTSGSDRVGFDVAASLDVASIAGTSKTFRVEAQTFTGMGSRLDIDASTSSWMRIRFEEEPI